MLININLPRSKGMNGRPRGQEVKGHRRRKLYLEVNKNIENAMSCNHKDNEKTCKWSTAVQSSWRPEVLLLLHVESREGAQQRHRRHSRQSRLIDACDRRASIAYPRRALHPRSALCLLRWRRLWTWPATFRDDKDASHCVMLIAEWVGHPFYCRWRTTTMNGRSNS